MAKIKDMEDKFEKWMGKRIEKLMKEHDVAEDPHVKISAGGKKRAYTEIREYYVLNVKNKE